MSEMTCSNGSNLPTQVQWNWVEVGTLENMLRPYDVLNNYRIEKAYR